MQHPDGGEFDQAHQESFLFHLFGARDGFLAELNEYYQAGLPNDGLTPGKVWRALASKSISSAELREIRLLEQDRTSWYSQAKLMRDHSSHVQGVRRSYHLGGADHRKVKLKNPETGQEADDHFVDMFAFWLTSMAALIARLRRDALRSTGLAL